MLEFLALVAGGCSLFAIFFVLLVAFGAVVNGAALYSIAAIGFGFTANIWWFIAAGAVATLALNKWVVQILWAIGVLLIIWFLIGGPVPVYQSFGG